MIDQEMKFIELETKYKGTISQLYPFKHLMEQQEGFSFLYIESDDVYFVKDDDFLRYRFSDDKKDKRAELTFKKRHSAYNNIKRTEVNMRVDPNKKETVIEFVEGLGYSKNFTISKSCHIYKRNDVTLVFYSVRDEDNSLSHFMEIEIAENAGITEPEGWEIIKTWEKILEPLGVKPQNRLRKSLFDMYRK